MKLYVAVVGANPDPQPWRRTYVSAIKDPEDSMDMPLPNVPRHLRRDLTAAAFAPESCPAFVGPDKDRVIVQALAYVKKIGDPYRYRVLVGELTTEVREPANFEEIPLNG